MYFLMRDYFNVSDNATNFQTFPETNQGGLTILAANICYFVGLISVWLTGSVAWYEISGKMTNFRTVTNQIMSSAIIAVRLFSCHDEL